ncbi:MAG: hypothetical protein JWO19_4384 [Bryobacterales bacterium]|nr:hypothetical protein [Bryobacterales bacterium]
MKFLILVGVSLLCFAVAVAFAIALFAALFGFDGWHFSAHVVDEDELRKAGL